MNKFPCGILKPVYLRVCRILIKKMTAVHSRRKCDASVSFKLAVAFERTCQLQVFCSAAILHVFLPGHVTSVFFFFILLNFSFIHAVWFLVGLRSFLAMGNAAFCTAGLAAISRQYMHSRSIACKLTSRHQGVLKLGRSRRRPPRDQHLAPVRDWHCNSWHFWHSIVLRSSLQLPCCWTRSMCMWSLLSSHGRFSRLFFFLWMNRLYCILF